MKKNTVQKDLPLGLYIHIPFCRSKCAYCDFYSLAGAEERMDDYCRALERHLAEVAPQAECHKADTVYFGGGTPSYLGAERLCRLLGSIRKLYKVDKHAEITLEANPDSATDRKALKRLRKAGFNRLSLGVQSMDDALLQAIGRIHTRQQVQEAVAAARKAGFKNLSLDLIYGLPGQTMEGWEKTLSDAVGLHPEHLSCYGLKLEEGTPLYRRQGELTFPDEDMQADMYLYTVEFLKQCGYEQYEISNFAKPGFASRHNLKYWLMQEYAGFGPGAHSDFGNVRYGYARDLERFGSVEKMTAKPGQPENSFTVSMLPWRSFEGFNLNIAGNEYLLPIFTIGKYQETDGGYFIPLAIQVHHAVCDGFHVCRFINALQASLDSRFADC